MSPGSLGCWCLGLGTQEGGKPGTWSLGLASAAPLACPHPVLDSVLSHLSEPRCPSLPGDSDNA